MDEANLEELAGGYRAAQVVFTACRLNLFQLLGTRRCTVAELAAELETDPRGTRVLLDALSGLGILISQDGRYRNTPAALECLRPGTAGSRHAQMLHGARLYERWSGLLDSVRSGLPVPDERIDPRLQGSKEAFALAMADSARKSAGPTAQALEAGTASNLLDVGGGPGVYAIEFARRYPGLHVTILDDAETLEVARVKVREAKLGTRIDFLPGDVFSDHLEGPYDLVLVSNVVHIYPPDRNELLVARCAGVLNSGGRLALKDFFLPEGGPSGKTGPLWSLLFAVNMLVGTDGGDCYTEDEAFAWCRNAGLEPERRLPLTEQTVILTARRP